MASEANSHQKRNKMTKLYSRPVLETGIENSDLKSKKCNKRIIEEIFVEICCARVAAIKN
jgi:hypothetical protein